MTAPRVTPRYVRKIVANKDGFTDLNSKEVQIVFDHLPAKGKNVDWKKAAESLGEDLLASRKLHSGALEALGEVNRHANVCEKVISSQGQTIRREVALAADMEARVRWARAHPFLHLFTTLFRSARS